MTPNFRMPGPTPLPPAVLEAMQRPMISHRGSEFKAMYRETLAMARAAHRTEHPVLLWPASGSAGWEAAIVNLLAPGDRVVAAVCGDFGDRFAKVGAIFGLDVRRLDVEWGRAVTPEAMAAALDESPGAKAVFLTLNETATGVTNPVKELAAVARERGALALVDAVSGAGALPMEVDAWGLDFVMSGSQKAWMTPPGLLIAAIGPRAWEAAERGGYPRFYWDFRAAREQAEQGMTPTTPALSTVYAFNVALRMMLDEGMENVWARHHRLGELTREGIAAAGLRLYADPDLASDTVTAFLPPEGVTGSEFVARLKQDHGVVATVGQGYMKDRMVRVGHMGWAFEPEMREAVEAIAATARSFDAAPVAR